jgi:hypothetical protein
MNTEVSIGTRTPLHIGVAALAAAPVTTDKASHAPKINSPRLHTESQRKACSFTTLLLARTTRTYNPLAELVGHTHSSLSFSAATLFGCNSVAHEDPWRARITRHFWRISPANLQISGTVQYGKIGSRCKFEKLFTFALFSKSLSESKRDTRTARIAISLVAHDLSRDRSLLVKFESEASWINSGQRFSRKSSARVRSKRGYKSRESIKSSSCHLMPRRHLITASQ